MPVTITVAVAKAKAKATTPSHCAWTFPFLDHRGNETVKV